MISRFVGVINLILNLPDQYSRKKTLLRWLYFKTIRTMKRWINKQINSWTALTCVRTFNNDFFSPKLQYTLNSTVWNERESYWRSLCGHCGTKKLKLQHSFFFSLFFSSRFEKKCSVLLRCVRLLKLIGIQLYTCRAMSIQERELLAYFVNDTLTLAPIWNA